MTLGEEQKEALSKLEIFSTTPFVKDEFYSLVGAAGTGKSLLMGLLVDFLKEHEIPFKLCAPTHKAALILRTYCHTDTTTIHSMLALSPKLDILKFDIRDLQFYSLSRPTDIPRGVVICDEASMINDDLFDLLLKKCNQNKTKLIFVSDKAQLMPVNGKSFSKVYDGKNQIILTKIYRQSSENCLVPVLQNLRENEITDLYELHSKEGNLIITNDLKEFLQNAAKDIDFGINEMNIFNAKVTTYTNKRVSQYNRLIQHYMFNDSELFHPGDILTAYANGNGTDLVFDKLPKNHPFYNGMDYVIRKVEKSSKKIPHYKEVEGYKLTLYDLYYEEEFFIFMITNQNELNNIAEIMEHYRLIGIKQKRWREFYSIQDSFCSNSYAFYDDRCIVKKTFDLGYCSTVHKLQGSSYNKIYVDLKTIKTCKDPLERRQLEYVAFSRTRNDVIVYDSRN